MVGSRISAWQGRVTAPHGCRQPYRTPRSLPSPAGPLCVTLTLTRTEQDDGLAVWKGRRPPALASTPRPRLTAKLFSSFLAWMTPHPRDTQSAEHARPPRPPDWPSGGPPPLTSVLTLSADCGRPPTGLVPLILPGHTAGTR